MRPNEMREKYLMEFCRDMIEAYTRYLEGEASEKSTFDFPKSKTEFMLDSWELVKEAIEMEEKNDAGLYREEICRDMFDMYVRYLKKKAKPEPEAELILDSFELTEKFWSPVDPEYLNYLDEMAKWET